MELQALRLFGGELPFLVGDCVLAALALYISWRARRGVVPEAAEKPVARVSAWSHAGVWASFAALACTAIYPLVYFQFPLPVIPEVWIGEAVGENLWYPSEWVVLAATVLLQLATVAVLRILWVWRYNDSPIASVDQHRLHRASVLILVAAPLMIVLGSVLQASSGAA